MEMLKGRETEARRFSKAAHGRHETWVERRRAARAKRRGGVEVPERRSLTYALINNVRRLERLKTRRSRESQGRTGRKQAISFLGLSGKRL